MNKVSFKSWVAALLAALILTAGTALAQSDLGSIQGFVKDQTGAVVANAKILVKNEAGLERSATTSDAGYFNVTIEWRIKPFCSASSTYVRRASCSGRDRL